MKLLIPSRPAKVIFENNYNKNFSRFGFDTILFSLSKLYKNIVNFIKTYVVIEFVKKTAISLTDLDTSK